MNNHEIQVQAMWSKQECPLVNGIVYGDGRMTEVQIERPREGSIELVRGLSHEGDSLDDYYSSPLTEYCSVESAPHDLRISSGAGDNGSYGYVAVANLSDEYLRWICFFTDSNEFDRLSLSGETIIATNNLDETFKIPLFAPSEMRAFPCGW